MKTSEAKKDSENRIRVEEKRVQGESRGCGSTKK